MATLTNRNLEDEFVDASKARAPQPPSLEAEVRVVLRDLVAGGSPASLRDPADRIAALTPKVPRTDSTEPIRAFAVLVVHIDALAGP